MQIWTNHIGKQTSSHSGMLPVTTPSTSTKWDTQTMLVLPLITSTLTRSADHHYPLCTSTNIALAQMTLKLRRVGSAQSQSAQISPLSELCAIRRRSCLMCIVIDLCSPLVRHPSRQYMIMSLFYVSPGG
jgi:hypothetical protein